MEESNLDSLKSLGVKDSKKLTPEARTRLAAEIPRIAVGHHIVELDTLSLDRVVNKAPKFQRLNLLEAKKMAEVVEALRPEIVYVDSSDTDTERFRNNILDELTFRPRVISEHHADDTYPVVSAASILAKVRRDLRIDEIKAEYGDFGSGYAHDPDTIRFLGSYYKANKEFPPIVRRSWKTLRNIVRDMTQTRL